ncbi:hypothetical protein, partial [Streptomyces mirabilis]|uniref:hypothetical protein n=1 Tax=Streptomyces mirabilis TaxID=68239 RepID=UPI0036758DFE
PRDLSKIIARGASCPILDAWHFDHAHAPPHRPAARAAAPSPTAAPAIAALARQAAQAQV